MIDIAREALALSGYTLNYQITNWARAKLMVQRGEAEGIVGMARSSRTEPLYLFPETPLGESQLCFYRKVGSTWHYSDTGSLQDRHFGWINDYGFGNLPGMDDWIKAHLHTDQVLAVSGENTHQRLFSLLLIGRIDTFAEDRNVITYALHREQLSDQIEVAGCASAVDSVYLAFDKQDPQSPNGPKR